MGDFKNSQDVVDAWMASPDHRDNILNNQYMDIGVSAKRGMFEGREVWIAVQHFGLSAEVCPVLNNNLEKEISVSKKNLENQSNQITNNEQIQEYNNSVEKLKTKIT